MGEIFIPEEHDREDGVDGKQLTQQEVQDRMEKFEECRGNAIRIRELSNSAGDTELMTDEDFDRHLNIAFDFYEDQWGEGMNEDRND